MRKDHFYIILELISLVEQLLDKEKGVDKFRSWYSQI